MAVSDNYMLRMLAREDRRLMTTKVTVSRGVWPSVTNVATDVPAVVRPSGTSRRTVQSGGDQLDVAAYDVRLPAGQDVVEGDVLTVTASRDSEMVGRWLTVDHVLVDEWQTSRRVVCSEARRG